MKGGIRIGGGERQETETLEEGGFHFFQADDRHYGNCFPFAYWRGEPLCILGPDAYMNIPLLGFILVFLYLGENLFVSSRWYFATSTIFFVFKYTYLAVVISLLLKNPGIRSRRQTERPPGLLPPKDFALWHERHNRSYPSSTTTSASTAADTTNIADTPSNSTSTSKVDSNTATPSTTSTTINDSDNNNDSDNTTNNNKDTPEE